MKLEIITPEKRLFDGNIKLVQVPGAKGSFEVLKNHAPIISTLTNAGYIEPRAYGQNQCFEAAIMFARNEGIIPAPESSHAIRAAIDEALAAKERDEKKVILFNLSGHGHFDMAAYDAYLAGQLTDNGFSAEEMAKSLTTVPQV